MSISARLRELGIELPAVARPVAAYVPALVAGSTVRTSGQLPFAAGELTAVGAVGPGGLDPRVAQAAARQAGLNALAAAAAAAGGVDRLARVVKVTGFVASKPGFVAQPGVVDGASNLYQEVFGSAHARSAVGVSQLPLDAPVEIEAEFELA